MSKNKLVRVPAELVDDKIVYGHPDGYFVNKDGVRVKHDYTPNRPHCAVRKFKPYPKLRYYGNKDCHYLMACTFLRVPDKSLLETVDHINGNTLDYSLQNLRIISDAINRRDGGFLRKLKNKGIDATMFCQTVLLAYFDRMAEFKSSHSRRAYVRLTKKQLLEMVVGPNFVVEDPEKIMEYEMTHHCEC